MNLIVTLPPKAEQEVLVERWVEMLLGESGFEEFQTLVGQCVKAGFSIHGISCLLLHQSTVETTLKKVQDCDSLLKKAAFSKSISLN